MKSLTICILLCLPALLLAAEFNIQSMLANYANKHPNTGEDEPECEILNKEDLEVGPLNAIVDRKRLWTDKTLYYEIQGSYSELEVTTIKDALADIVDSTSNCVKIEESSSAFNRVVIKDCGGCSSYIGMIGGQQQMCLTTRCIARYGSIIHEFLHAFGFHHEQCRSDRDEHIFINFANIRSGTEHAFRKLVEGVSVDLLGTKYDYSSIMHYAAYAFAKDRSIPTIIPLDPTAIIGKRVSMSDTDIERVQLLYSCKRAADTVYFKHLAHLY